jgi:hypothetical protein
MSDDIEKTLGFHAKMSWLNLKKTAENLGIVATLNINRNSDPKYDCGLLVTYADKNNESLPVITELHEHGKAATYFNGERIKGTGFTLDDVWQSDAIKSAVAKAFVRGALSSGNAQEQSSLPRMKP